MKFNPRARLDTSGTSDTRASGGLGGRRAGGAVAIGGGGIGLVVLLLFVLLGGNASDLGTGSGLVPGAQSGPVAPGQLEQACQSGADIEQVPECRFVAYATSVEDYWRTAVRGWQPARDRYFAGGVSTGCGAASSQVGPFYCPADSTVYLDLGFFRTLQSRFGARGGDFAEAYVVAHEYGHHVQALTGQTDRVRTRQGPESDAVRLELQADCYAGVWAHHATATRDEQGEVLITEIDRADIAEGLDAAQVVGDDYIQSTVGGGRVDPETWTHGSSEQRQRWFTVGYSSGRPGECDTFSAERL